MQHHRLDFTDVERKERNQKTVASVAGKERDTHGDSHVPSTGGSSNSINRDQFNLLNDFTVPRIPTVITKSRSTI